MAQERTSATTIVSATGAGALVVMLADHVEPGLFRQSMLYAAPALSAVVVWGWSVVSPLIMMEIEVWSIRRMYSKLLRLVKDPERRARLREQLEMELMQLARSPRKVSDIEGLRPGKQRLPRPHGERPTDHDDRESDEPDER